MRYKKIVTRVILTILFLSLIDNLGNNRSFAEDNKPGSIAHLLELSNNLGNQYEEVDTALRFQVNAAAKEEIDRTAIADLIIIQNNFVDSWNKFCGHDPKIRSIPENCNNGQNQDLVKQVNSSLKVLSNKIAPFLAPNQPITEDRATTNATILTQQEYIKYREYLIKLDDYKENQEGDEPKNPLSSSTKVIVTALQDFIKAELGKTELKEYEKPIIAKIDTEPGIFYIETRKGLKIVSTKQNRNIKKNLIKINNEIIAQQEKKINNYQGFVFGIPPNIVNGISWLLSLLTLVAVSLLFYKNSKLSKTHQEIENGNQDIKSSTPDISQSYQNLELQEAFTTGQTNQIEKILEDNNKALLSGFDQLLSDLKKYLELKKNNEPSNQSSSKRIEHQETNNESQQSINIFSIGNTLKDNDNIDGLAKGTSPNPQSQSFLEKLVTNYNKSPKKLVKNIVKVAATKESIEQRRLGIKTSLILKENDNDSFWIILEKSTPDGNYYLVPKANLIIGDRIYQTVEYIFNCGGYENKSSNNFTLVRPAEVKFLRGIAKNQEYELLEPGELRFDQN